MTQDLQSYFIFLNKPVGLSSQQALSRFKRKFGIKKIGHHGTLDPFASGLLLAGIGDATKFFRFVDDRKKTYIATLRLGIKTDTLDHTGQVIEEKPVPDLTEEQILKTLQSLTGKIQQTPPMYSAIKIDGERLYKLAREGVEVERESREVEIFDLRLIERNQEFLKISATVSRGTYIRVLAEQIAEKLGTLAHLTELVRTELSEHDLKHAFDFESCDSIPAEKKLAVPELLLLKTHLALDEQQYKSLSQGKLTPLHSEQEALLSTSQPGDVVGFFDQKFIGILTNHGSSVSVTRLISQMP